MDFKDIIKEQRLLIGKTLEEVGNEVGVSRATVQRWESGEIKNIRHDKIIKLAKALKTTPAYIMGYETEDISAVSEELYIKNLYLEAAKLIANTAEDRLPIVLNLLKTAGFTLDI